MTHDPGRPARKGPAISVPEMVALAQGWHGSRGWQSRLAEDLGVDRSAVTRWIASGTVPGPAAAALRAWERCGLPPRE